MLNSQAQTLGSCELLKGTWRGKLASFKTTTMNIHRFDGMEDAYLSFTTQDDERVAYGMIRATGDCQISDNQITQYYERNLYGIVSRFQVTLLDEEQLRIDSFSYKDNWSSYQGNGMLEKLTAFSD